MSTQVSHGGTIDPRLPLINVQVIAYMWNEGVLQKDPMNDSPKFLVVYIGFTLRIF